MALPFTAAQFFDVFRRYNEAVWPVQVLLNLLALAAIGLCVRRRERSGPVVAAILALLWAWTGIAYHLMQFTAINRAAIAFGVLFLAGAGAFLRAGVARRQLDFATRRADRRAAGAILVAYALLVYPVLSWLLGHGYPAMPTFGLPCPTTIFTVGVLCLLAEPFPRYVLAAPLLWSAVGSFAAFLLGVYQDLGLLVAGGAAIWLLPRRRVAR